MILSVLGRSVVRMPKRRRSAVGQYADQADQKRAFAAERMSAQRRTYPSGRKDRPAKFPEEASETVRTPRRTWLKRRKPEAEKSVILEKLTELRCVK